jgi:hypothetical protein
MNRRSFLLRGTTVAITGALAGCAEDDSTTEPDANESDNETQGTDDNGQSDQQEAQEPYNEAIELLETVKESLDAWANDEIETAELSIDDLRSKLGTANDKLDEAADAASGELAQQIEYAQAVADIQAKILQFAELGPEFDQHLSDGTILERDQKHREAITEYQASIDLISDALNLLDEIENAQSDVDFDAFEEASLDYSGDAGEYVEVGSTATYRVMETFVIGLIDFNRALTGMKDGLEQLERDASQLARDEFEAGKSKYADARNRFESVVNDADAPPQFRTRAEKYISFIDSTMSGFDRFLEATDAAEAENYDEVESLIDEGEAIFEQQDQP